MGEGVMARPRAQQRQTAPGANPRVSSVSIASLIDFKLAEFVRLGDFRRFVPLLSRGDGGGETIAAGIDTYSDFSDELEKVQRKIKRLRDLISPPPPPPEDELDMPVMPPVREPPAAGKLDDVKKSLEKAKTDADNLDPDKAIDYLKKAKDQVRDKDIKKEIKDKQLPGSYYDIIKEINDMIRYLQGLL